MGTHAAAAVALAGGVLLGALGAVQNEVTSRIEGQATAANLGTNGAELPGALLALAFFIVDAKGGDGDFAAGA
ncbi:hypothetical protein AF72_13475 [Xylella taiwanensis]|uniref:Uncharacterized protein n=1 Tax=Xylella taiwanensis TaxID=1444770 RepID=Z9JFI2_9GAMM|nr:hypothetical protein AF72_13475 [Xylella taiwanensis]